MVSEWPVPLQIIGWALRDWWDDWVNMAVINLLWWLCWLTLALGPPATFGLYYVTNQLAQGKSLGPKGLLEGGRRYFGLSWLWFLLNLAAVLVWGVNYFFYASLTTAWAGFLQAFFLLLGLAWLLVQFYALPYLMEQEQKQLRLALRNGFLTALAAPGYTLVVAGVAAALTVISISAVVPLFLGGPCLLAALGNRAVRERMEAYGVRDREARGQE